MLADPANSVDALRMRCIADQTPVDEETGRAYGFLKGVEHFDTNFVSRSGQVKADDAGVEGGAALARQVAGLATNEKRSLVEAAVLAEKEVARLRVDRSRANELAASELAEQTRRASTESERLRLLQQKLDDNDVALQQQARGV